MGEVLSHPHISLQAQLQRVPPPSERPGLLPILGSRDMGRGDADRGPIRPLMDLQVRDTGRQRHICHP